MPQTEFDQHAQVNLPLVGPSPNKPPPPDTVSPARLQSIHPPLTLRTQGTITQPLMAAQYYNYHNGYALVKERREQKRFQRVSFVLTTAFF